MAQFSCCGIKFDGEPAYIDHRQKVHGEQPDVKHTCCGIKFYTDEGYAEHREKVHGEAKAVGRKSFLGRLFKKQ